MKQAVMLLAEGFEEVEALMTADLLMRGGVDVKLVSVSGEKQVSGSHQIAVGVNLTMDEIRASEPDAVILPGGMPGTLNLGKSEAVTGFLRQMNEAGKIVAAICAAPSVLGACGVLRGRKATCYPGFEDKLTGAHFVDEMAVVDGNIVTSRGLGTSMEFGFALIEQLVSREKADEVRKQIVFQF